MDETRLGGNLSRASDTSHGVNMVTSCNDSTPKQFYVYVHRRASDGRVFYVGKGTGRRAWALNGRNKHWHNIVAKHGCSVEIAQYGMQEWWAFELERDLISSYGRESLCNLTDGGDGASGAKRSIEVRKRMSDFNPMKNPIHRAAVSAAKKGKKRPDLSINPVMSRPGVKEKVSGENSGVARPVVCIETGERFVTVAAASMWLSSIGFAKASSGDISKCCKGKAKKSHGFRWAYATK